MKIYLMLHPARPYRVKIGISGNTSRRAAQVGGFPVFSGSVWLARELEQSLHALYAPLNSPQRDNGGTEWFWIVNVVSAALIANHGLSWWWAVLLVPFPLDLFALLFAFWAVQRAAVLAAVASLLYLFST